MKTLHDQSERNQNYASPVANSFKEDVNIFRMMAFVILVLLFLLVSISSSIAQTTGDAQWNSPWNYRLNTATNGEYSFDFQDSGGDDVWGVWAPTYGSIFSVKSNGKVGILTSNPTHTLSFPGGNNNMSLGDNIFLNGQGAVGRISNNAYTNLSNTWQIADVSNKATTIELHDNGVVEMYGTVTAGQPDWRPMFGFDAPNNKVYFPNGNIGIGTSVPTEKLELNGVIKATNKTYAPGTHDNVKIWSEDEVGVIETNGDENGMILRSVLGRKVVLDALNVHIPTSTGRFGIGTAAPNEALELRSASPVVSFQHTIGATVKMGMDGSIFKISPMDNGMGGSTGNFANNDTQGLSVNNLGNVGIGTINQGNNKLAVNGTIRAKEVVVESENWPDFVFENSYNLQPLNELESYIKDNGHLPGVPSASEVKENGVGLGQMDKVLLQKVEELTLYVIELKKENDALKARLDK